MKTETIQDRAKQISEAAPGTYMLEPMDYRGNYDIACRAHDMGDYDALQAAVQARGGTIQIIRANGYPCGYQIIIPAPTECLRKVAHCMGAWRWGYPRGIRTAVVRYIQRPDKRGILRWWSAEEICSGITAATAHLYQHLDHGSLHRQAIASPDRDPRGLSGCEANYVAAT
jgi:hypothetical protein